MSTENHTFHPAQSIYPETKGQELLQLANQNVEKYRKGKACLQFLNSAGEPIANLEVKIVQKTQRFLFGNLIFDLVWGDPPYRSELFKERFCELFNFAIFPFYWSHYERQPGVTEGHKLLPVLEWCRANNITPKGHPLVWPYTAGVPEWLYSMPVVSLAALTEARVISLVHGYAQDINIWDVTNEAINHISWQEATQPAFHSRYHETDLWRGIPVAGAFKREIAIKEATDWVEQSFRWAYTANPAATLIVNDYNQIVDPHVRQRFFDLVRELQDRGTPVSGLGLQAHPINYWLSPQEVWDTLEMYAKLDCPIHITELIQPAWAQEIEGEWRRGTWSEEAQSDYLGQLYCLFFGHPSVVSINYWGLSDRNCWLPQGGLIDSEYRPKPVFKMLKKLIRDEWTTAPFKVWTGKEGSISFNGFYGNYEVTIHQPEKRHSTFQFYLSEKSANNWVFYL